MDINEIISSGLLELYVTGTASQEEVTQVENWAKKYPEIKTEITLLQEAIESYTLSQAISPDESIKEKILSRVNTSLPQATHTIKSTSGNGSMAPVYKIPSYFKIAAAACLALLLGSLVLNYSFYNKYQSSNNKLFAVNKKYDSVYNLHTSDSSALLAAQQNINDLKRSVNNKQQLPQKENNQLVIHKENPKPNNPPLKENNQQLRLQQNQNPDMNIYANVAADKYSVPVVLKGTKHSPDALAKIFWMKNTGEVYVDATYLPQPPLGKQYQLWAIVNGEPIDAGMINTPRGTYKIQKMKSFGSAEAFAITRENTGGSTTPNMKEMIVKAKI